MAIESGEQCVMTPGVLLMEVLCVGSLASAMVCGKIEFIYSHADSFNHVSYLYHPNAASSAPCCAYFGRGIGSILLDNVGCIGTESRLFDCYHIGLGINNCAHSSDAGVVCIGKGYIYYA